MRAEKDIPFKGIEVKRKKSGNSGVKDLPEPH